MDNAKRIGFLKEKLSEESKGFPNSLRDLSKARLSTLTLEDSHYQAGDNLSKNIQSLIDESFDEVFIRKASGDYDEARLLSNLALTSLIDLNAVKPNTFGKQNFSKPEAEPLVQIMNESDYGYLGALALSRQEMSFDKATVSHLGGLTDYLKSYNTDVEGEINYEQLMQGFLVCKDRLDRDIQISDSKSLSNTLTNLMAHTTHRSISRLMSDNPDVSYLVYNSAGREFAAYVYDTAITDKNTDYAMSLLLNRKSGVLTKGDVFASSDKKVRQLFSIIAQDEDSLNRLNEVLDSATTPVQKTVVLESIIDSHNGLHIPEQIESLFDKGLEGLSQSQVEQIGYKLLQNSYQQPTERALEKLFDIASETDIDVSQLREAKEERDIEFRQKVQELDKPIGAYSTVTLNDTKSNKALAVRDVLSPTHLDYILDNEFNIEVNELRVFGSNSLLDENVKTAVMDYLETGDKKLLSDVLLKPITEAYKNSEDSSRIFHEACYQDSQLPKQSDNIMHSLISKVVDDNCYVRNDNKVIIALSELREASDLRDALEGVSVGTITVDKTSLGEEFDDELSKRIKDFSAQPLGKANEDSLNRLLGLPLNFSSSKIDENQVKFNKSQQSNSNISESSPEVLLEQENGAIDTNVNTGLSRLHK